MQKKPIRKYKRGQAGKQVKEVLDELTLDEMFERFMTFKKTEALAPRTISDYYNHFEYFKEFTGDELSSDDMTLELFRGFIGFMLHDKNLSPVTANVRIRTMRAFIRFCFNEGYIDSPIHENSNQLKHRKIP
jgi:integrase/recombinase XerD